VLALFICVAGEAWAGDDTGGSMLPTAVISRAPEALVYLTGLTLFFIQQKLPWKVTSTHEGVLAQASMQSSKLP